MEHFYRNDLYLEAVVERVNEALGRFQDPDAVELVFSAHSVPVAVMEKGDPYQQQIEETVALVMERGGYRNRHRLCYQSKVGASKWLQPSLRSTLRTWRVEDNRRCLRGADFVCFRSRGNLGRD